MRGIDIYHGDGFPLKSVPAKAYRESDFVIVKATQGICYNHIDYFTKMADKTLKDGKLLGAYHYASGKDAEAEADYFVRIVKPYLGKTVLFLDWERGQNKAWGSKTWCSKFISRVKAKTGLDCILYTGLDGIKQNASLANKVPLWFAGYPDPNYSGWTVPKFKYNISPWKAWTIWQFTSSGEKVDRNTTLMTPDQWRAMAVVNKTKETETQLRKRVVDAGMMLLGVRERSSEHKMILDTFNKSGLCKRYKMTVDDAWCATFVSFVFIATKLAGKNNLFPCVECSCAKMVELAKKYGIWVEKDSYSPKAGDVILYDWQDSGKGDNTGSPDHVGIVKIVKNGINIVIEGNYNDSVKIRELKVNGRYIRGYICPKYALFSTPNKTTTEPAKSPQKPAQKLEGYKWKYPSLPPRGYYKFGDGYKQIIGYELQIKRLQKLINWITNGKIKEDGQYGQKTIDAVKKAQKILGVKQDGLFGADTLAKARAFKK